MDTLADALPREIARVSAKRDRWRDMIVDMQTRMARSARLKLTA